MSDSDEEDDGHGDKKKNNQNYKKRILEPTKPLAESNGVHKPEIDSKMDVSATEAIKSDGDSDAAKVRKLDEEAATKKPNESEKSAQPATDEAETKA